jgi:hypothetical protein
VSAASVNSNPLPRRRRGCGRGSFLRKILSRHANADVDIDGTSSWLAGVDVT